MSQLSALFNSWLNQIGADNVVTSLADLIDLGAVVALDANNKVIFWSTGAEKLLGIPAEAAFGRDRRHVLGAIEEITPDKNATTPQAVQLQHAGGTITCNRKTRAFFDANGQHLGSLEFLQPQPVTAPSIKSQKETETFHGILSNDPTMQDAIKIIRNVAETEATVLIRGESGTGKELVAQALHLESNRRNQPFLAINCAALTPSLLESELFGHVKGAFTGAIRSHAGLFQRANGGTLFLDEVAELPLELQAKLLRVLQEQSFIPVGGDTAISVDVRIIAATHRSLREEVKIGRFREDLMYRLRVVPIFLPPLRERRLDLSLLLWYNIKQHNLQGPRHIDGIAPDAMRRLLDYPWPGNVRELKNVIEYAFAVGRGNELSLNDLPPEFHEPVNSTTSNKISLRTRAKYADEEKLLREALRIANGNLNVAARHADMSRATFWRKRKKYNL